MKVTAQWIAEQCGVSRGTVDRVVNGRPNVAPEVRERVQKIISEYGYKTPSQRQAARAGHGAFRIGVILPSWDAFFIRRMREGIRVAVHNRGLNDVNVLVEELKNRSHRAYFEAIGRMEERGIDGLIVTAPDTVAMSEEIDRLVAIGIPVVTCDSDVRQSRRLYHIGQNMVKSGRIAAGLLAPYVEGQDVLVVTGNREFTAHGLRVRGFLDRLHEIFDDNVRADLRRRTAAGAAEPASARYLYGKRVRARLYGRARARKAQSAHSRCLSRSDAACAPVFGGRTAGFHRRSGFFGADDARDRSAGAYTAYRRAAAAEHRIHSHQHYHTGIAVRKELI